MKTRPTTNQSLTCALKIVFGSIAAFVTFFTAVPACPPNVFCTIEFGFQPRLDVWSVGATFVAIAFLVSAGRDLISMRDKQESFGGDVESIAHRQNDNLDSGVSESDG